MRAACRMQEAISSHQRTCPGLSFPQSEISLAKFESWTTLLQFSLNSFISRLRSKGRNQSFGTQLFLQVCKFFVLLFFLMLVVAIEKKCFGKVCVILNETDTEIEDLHRE